MSTASRRACLVLILIAGMTSRPARAQTIPLEAADAEITDGGDLEYSLTNSGTQPATAWSLALTVKDPNGPVIRQTVITTDRYSVEARRGVAPDDEIDASLLMPNERRRFIVVGPFDSGFQLTLTPLAIVFIDRSSSGQPHVIANIFRGRAAERDAKLSALHQLRDRMTKRGKASLDPDRALGEQIDVVLREYNAALQHSIPRKEQ